MEHRHFRKILALALLLALLSGLAVPARAMETAYQTQTQLATAARELITTGLDPREYLDLEEYGLTDSQTQAMEQLVETITDGCETVSAKLQAITFWVADNICYDYPTYYGSADRLQDPYTVQKTGLAICYGYSNLTAYLLRAAGIPCITIHGIVPTQNNGEHRWSAAWTGSRWLFADPCWMSHNVTYDGKTLTYLGYDVSWYDIGADREVSRRQFAFPESRVTIDGCAYQVELDWDKLTLICTPSGSLNNLTPVRAYNDAFSDVDASAWYYTGVAGAYALGLVDGSDGLYRPDDSITLAQAVKLLVQVQNRYGGGDGSLPQTWPWYQAYINYAEKHQLFDTTLFEDYTQPATRAQLAYILASALPQSQLVGVNQTASIPGVSSANRYYSAIRLLYRAGVLTGVDEAGSFNPTALVTRAQAAVILNRLTDPSARVG